VRTTSPGDLHSYTREAWNRRMAELFPHEPSYRHDYIENQIVAQALALEHGGGVTKALEYGWAMSGEITASAAWTISSFSENRWTFQSSVYAGFAFNFWGVGQASFMVGTTFDTQTKVRTITDDSWGVNATFDLPAPSRDPDAIQEYDFTMYFLPANRQWTVEFRHLNPDLAGQIDEFSESWKIVCVVTRIVRNGELAELAAHGLGDGAIAVLRSSGITTIAQLLQRHGARAREDAIARRLAREDLDPPAHAALAAAKAWVAANEWRDRG